MSENNSKSKLFEKNESKSTLSKKDAEFSSSLYHAEGPLEHEIDDEFHHIEVVDVLETAILRSEGSLNIALYGGWGVGKSSIINFLKSRVDSKSILGNFQIVIIDAWKLSPEILKQELLEELASELKMPEEEQNKIHDELYNTQEIKSELPLTQRQRIRYWFTNKLVPLYFVPVILFGLNSLGDYFDKDLLTSSIISSILIPLSLFAFKHVFQTQKNLERTSRKLIQKAASSHQFKKLFENIITYKKKSKLIITIDNLDRCDEQTAVSILGNVKSFMGNKDCIYVVPCDESALLHHLERKYGTASNPKHAKEFLRKFFQIIINVPPNIKSDLSGYVDTLMKQFSDIEFDSKVNEILITGGLSNPRKIRQYLYNLSIQYRLADLREKNPDNILTLGKITKNTGFLTKLIVIRDEWPTIYEKLQSRPTLLNAYHEYLRDPTIIYDELNKEISRDFTDFPDFSKFMRATSLTVLDDIRPFLKLSQEPYETKHGGYEQINSHASQNNLEELNQDLSSLTFEETQSSFKGLLSLIQYHIDNRDSQYAFNVMNCLLELYEKLSKELRVVLLEKFSNYLSSTPELRQSMNKFDTEKIFSLIMNMKFSIKEQLLNEYCMMLSKFRPVDTKLIDQFINHSNNMSQKIKIKFDEELNQLCNADENEFLKIIEKLSESESGMVLIGPNMIEGLSDRIVETPTPENIQKVSFFFNLIQKASLKAKKQFTNRLLITLDDTRISSLDGNSQWSLDTLSKLAKIDSQFSEPLFSVIRKLYTKFQNRTHKIAVLKVIFELLPNVDNTWIDEFMKNEFEINTLIQNPAQFQEILNLSKETNASLLNHKVIFEQVNARFATLPPHDDMYTLFLQETPDEKLNSVLKTIQKKIASFDPNLINVVIASLSKSNRLLSSEQYDLLGKTILDRLNQYTFDQNNGSFGKLFSQLDDFSPKLLLESANVMTAWLLINNQTQMNQAKNYMVKILEKLSFENKISVFVILLNALSQRLSGNQIDMAKYISPLIFENKDDLDSSLMQKLTDLLYTQLIPTKPPVIHNYTLEKLSELGIKDTKIHNSILSLRKLTTNRNIQNLCDKTCSDLGLLSIISSDSFDIAGGVPEDEQISETLTKRLSVTPNNDGVIFLEYDAPVKFGPKKNKTTCSDIRIHIRHDGKDIRVSDWLGYPGRDGDNLPLSTGIIKIDGLKEKCDFEFVPEGREGGCNHGHVANWQGTIYVYGLKT